MFGSFYGDRFMIASSLKEAEFHKDLKYML